MREIKFRGWLPNIKKMTYEHTLEELTKGNLWNMDGETNCSIVWLQYTGLKDKNGKEIYEGDIIQDERGKKYLIKWGINSNGFIAKTNEAHCNVYSSYHLSFKTQVIGNIHDNPELLEAK